jgi:flagellar hook-basal body complex protein FliE
MQIKPLMASQAYTQALAATQPADEPGRGAGAAFAAATTDFFETMRSGEEAVKAGLAGRADAQAVVEALAQTELAVQTAVAVRDRVVEAYQEILRMPV